MAKHAAAAPKLLRYAAVSVFNIVLGQTLLFLFLNPFALPPAVANIGSVAISIVPAYLLSKRWVWAREGGAVVAADVIPFAALNGLGLVLSTFAVVGATRTFSSPFAGNIASIGAFGVVWLLKFFVLEKLIWGSEGDAAADAVIVEPTSCFNQPTVPETATAADPPVPAGGVR